MCDPTAVAVGHRMPPATRAFGRLLLPAHCLLPTAAPSASFSRKIKFDLCEGNSLKSSEGYECTHFLGGVEAT